MITVAQHVSVREGIVETKSKQTKSRWRRESFLMGLKYYDYEREREGMTKSCDYMREEIN